MVSGEAVQTTTPYREDHTAAGGLVRVTQVEN